MLYQINSNNSLEEIEHRLHDSAARHRFGVIATHDLRDMMNRKGVNLDMECKIYEVCDPLQAKQVLARSRRRFRAAFRFMDQRANTHSRRCVRRR